MNNLTLLLCSFIRDHPKTIKQRFRSVFVVSLMSPLYVWLWADGTSDETVRLQIVYTVKPLFTDTRLIWTSHYYGQFAFSYEKKALTFSLNSTRLMWTLSMALLSSVLMKCDFILNAT